MSSEGWADTEGLASTGRLAGGGVTSAEPYEYALIRVVREWSAARR